MKPNNAIRNIMTTNLITVKPDTPIIEVRDVFQKNTFHHLPVVAAGSRLVGIISREDYFKIYNTLAKNTAGRTWTEKEIAHLKAKDIMSEHPMSLDPDDTIGLAGDIFLANKYHALPIVEDDELQGIITVHDLLAYSFGDAKEPTNDRRYGDNTNVEGFETMIP